MCVRSVLGCAEASGASEEAQSQNLLAIEIEEAAERRHPPRTAAELTVRWRTYSPRRGERLVQERFQLGSSHPPQTGHERAGGAFAGPVVNDRAQTQVRL